MGLKMKTSVLTEIEFLTPIIPIFYYSSIPVEVKPNLNSLNLQLFKENV